MKSHPYPLLSLMLTVLIPFAFKVAKCIETYSKMLEYDKSYRLIFYYYSLYAKNVIVNARRIVIEFNKLSRFLSFAELVPFV